MFFATAVFLPTHLRLGSGMNYWCLTAFNFSNSSNSPDINWGPSSVTIPLDICFAGCGALPLNNIRPACISIHNRHLFNIPWKLKVCPLPDAEITACEMRFLYVAAYYTDSAAFQLPYVYTAVEGLWRAYSFTPTVAEIYLWKKPARCFFYRMTLKLLRTQFSCEVKSKFHKCKHPLLCILWFFRQHMLCKIFLGFFCFSYAAVGMQGTKSAEFGLGNL